jgi:hypothetical protein
MGTTYISQHCEAYATLAVVPMLVGTATTFAKCAAHRSSASRFSSTSGHAKGFMGVVVN